MGVLESTLPTSKKQVRPQSKVFPSIALQSYEKNLI